ncbi:hypothetical protein [Pararhizobium haloflavum]|uniref:hypothetical protein n=1 Tax=Pararhizobium haloflavum TaxID=2037914 RepID=UPI0013000124|nr:hypothetical protein [Pararhizobium haloflavum]
MILARYSALGKVHSTAVLPMMRRGAGALILILAASGSAFADEDLINKLSPRILFTISGGYWEAPQETGGDDAQADEGAAQRGYYRTIAYRAEDDTSRLYLQQIALGADGPAVLETREIEAIGEAAGYITDMRPENATGAAATPGFTAFIYMKSDREAAEPDMWELFIDEFGEVSVNAASN